MRRFSKILAVLLIGFFVPFSSQVFVPKANGQVAPPAGCHGHNEQTPFAPDSHQCCAVGHSPALPTYPSLSSPPLDISCHALQAQSPILIACHDPGAAIIKASASLPSVAPLRV